MLFPLNSWENSEYECKFLYKITCFLPIEEKRLKNNLKGLGFKVEKNYLEWRLDGKNFRVEPFLNQTRDKFKGYRIYFDCEYNTGLYLIDLALNGLERRITGIECIVSKPKDATFDWIQIIKRKRPYYNMTDSRGIFEKDCIGIIIMNNTAILQVKAKKNSKLNLVECINKIDSIREELMPTMEFDLFSLPVENEITA